MITCCIRYKVDRRRLAEFEEYARLWIGLIGRFGGTHHGYFLPAEGRSDEALALFSFASLSAYEAYRKDAASDPEAQAAVRFGEEKGCCSTGTGPSTGRSWAEDQASSTLRTRGDGYVVDPRRCGMRAKLARWGNSLALRLPAEVVRDFGLREGPGGRNRPREAGLRIKTDRPVVQGLPVYTLEEMVAEMDRLGPENEAEMVVWGPIEASNGSTMITPRA